MKRCPYCAEEIQDAAIKCRFCGSMVNQPPGTPAAPALPGAAASTAEPPAIFGGSPSWKARFWSYAGAVLLCVVGLAAGGVLFTVMREPPQIAGGVGAGALVVGLLWLGALDMARRGLRYRITPRTIDVESGLLSRRIETLQLWKVRDIEFEQTLFDRMLSVARIRVYTHDVTTPQFTLVGMPHSRDVFERLKQAIDLARQSRNVVGVVQ